MLLVQCQYVAQSQLERVPRVVYALPLQLDAPRRTGALQRMPTHAQPFAFPLQPLRHEKRESLVRLGQRLSPGGRVRHDGAGSGGWGGGAGVGQEIREGENGVVGGAPPRGEGGTGGAAPGGPFV